RDESGALAAAAGPDAADRRGAGLYLRPIRAIIALQAVPFLDNSISPLPLAPVATAKAWFPAGGAVAWRGQVDPPATEANGPRLVLPERALPPAPRNGRGSFRDARFREKGPSAKR